MFSRVRIAIAVLYFAIVLFAFVGLRYADPDWAEGGIPLVVITLPWSVPVLLIGGVISMIPGVGSAMATEGVNALMFVVLSGGLNVVLILGVSKVLHSLKSSLRLRIIGAVAATILVAGAELIMPSVDRDALERSKPPNVPQDAVHVGGAVGWWQRCTYDSTRKFDTCSIWNRAGLVLGDGEFVPEDGGSAAENDELRITDLQSGPYRIHLQNNRILIPKARQEK